MKCRFIPILFMMGTLLFASGCSDEGKEISYLPTVELSGANLLFTALGGSQILTATSQSPIKVTVQSDWCRVTKIDGNKITIEVDENINAEGRNARVLVSDGTSDVYAVVMQEGFYLNYDSSNTIIRMAKNGETVSKEFSGPLPIKIEVPENAQSWLTVTQKDDGLSFVATPNQNAPRGTRVVITSGPKKIEYEVLQYDLSELTSSVMAHIQLHWLDKDIPLKIKTSIKQSKNNSWNIDLSGIFSLVGIEHSLLLPAVYNENTGVFRIAAGQNLGLAPKDFGDGIYISTALLGGGYYSWSTSVSVDLVTTLQDDGKIVLSMQDNGSYDNPLEAFMLLFFNGKDFTGNALNRRFTMSISSMKFYPAIYFPKED